MTKKFTYVCRITELANDEDIAKQRIDEIISHGIKSDKIYDWFELEKVEQYLDLGDEYQDD